MLDVRRWTSTSHSNSFVFGLPGNPVSAFVCTVRLASRLLQRMAGARQAGRAWLSGADGVGPATQRPARVLPAGAPHRPGRAEQRAVVAADDSAASLERLGRPVHPRRRQQP